MTADPDSENPDLVKQHVKKNRMGDRKLAEKPGEEPPPPDGTESEGTVLDDDQRALIRNQGHGGGSGQNGTEQGP
jgi:hypothetical protein